MKNTKNNDGYLRTKSVEYLELFEETICIKNLVWDFVNDRYKGQNLYDYLYPVICEMKNSNKRIGLWGCGVRGIELLTKLNSEGMRIDCVIDSNEKRCGQDFCGYAIKKYEDIAMQLDIIIAANDEIKNAIEQIVENAKVYSLFDLAVIPY